MSGKEKIIATILDGANAEAENVLAEAKKRVEQIKADDEEFAKKTEADKNNKIAENELAILSRRRLVAELDVRKAVLAKKQEKLAEAFKTALEQISSSEVSYRAFITEILKQYASDNDTVVVSEKDKERIPASFVSAFAKENKLKLSYRADGKFSGGVILEGGSYDKNMTLETVIDEFKKDNESRIAAILFGE